MVEGAGTSGDHRRFFSASADGGAWPTGAAMGSRAKRRKDQISAVVSSAYAQTGPLLRTVRSSWSNLGRRCGCLGKIAAGRSGYRGILPPDRSEWGRVGHECVSTGRTRWAQYHSKKKKN